ncbi:3-oxo-5a-steroid 4- dehydrogenase [Blyttiomyces sp. JEL0837]|nr:3-oxo-5a-steroid 4- dehydrogenase [Blyttiomyces sp. JEL0837]
MKVVLKDRRGKIIKDALDIKANESDATVEDVCIAIAKAFPKWSLNRQKLTLNEKTVLERGKKLSDYNIKDGDAIIFKDLGLQVGWTTVFLIEYFGPLFIHPLFLFNQELIYGKSAPRTKVQETFLVLVLFHFFKRELETLFVHRFSNDTMPFRNLPKNCFHYWVLAGVNLAYWVYQPGFKGGLLSFIGDDDFVFYAIVGLYIYAQSSNLITHIILSNLRPAGSKIRQIPMGYGFKYVTCANYFYECLAWLSMAILTGSVAVYFFLAVSFTQMYLWAVKKHKRYIKEFGDKYPKDRKIIIPFIL